MVKAVSALAVLLMLSLHSGCVFTPYTYVENSEFDLKLPAFDREASQIRLGVFKNLSGSDRRFLCRRPDGRMVSMEYQRWLLSPELLLQRCMYAAFAVDSGTAGGDSAAAQVSCVLYRFEFDERDNAAKLSADFVVLRGGTSRLVRVDASAPVQGSIVSGAAGAAARGECAAQAISRLSEVLK